MELAADGVKLNIGAGTSFLDSFRKGSFEIDAEDVEAFLVSEETFVNKSV